MENNKFEEHLAQGRDYLVNTLKNKTGAKLDVYKNTMEWFKVFKLELAACIDLIKQEIDDDRIRLRYVEKGDAEAQLFIGSDVIIFNMHTNVFQLSPRNYASQTSYVRQNPLNGFCGIIRIYDFLADSYEYNRHHDVGYMIGRILINRESHFLMQGKGQLGFMYKDFMHQVLTKEVIKDIILRVSIHALDFDLFIPPYGAAQTATVQDLQTLNHSSQLKTGKRLGFKFEADENIT
ncbi:MAG: hypothetical protein GQ574_09285 [Crocinitomix sp.]|nr:hypothetical protein [Crocinitomix sp.]